MTDDEKMFNNLADGLSQLLDGIRSDIATEVLARTVAYLANQSDDPVEFANDFIVAIGENL